MHSVLLWKVLMSALELTIVYTVCKKEPSATLPKELYQSEPTRYSGVVADDINIVNKTPLILSAHFLTTVHTAGKQGPADTTNTLRPSTDTTVITPAPLPAHCSLVMPPVRFQGTEGSCVAFAVTYARACEQYYKNSADTCNDTCNEFSPEFVFNQVREPNCSGSSIVNSLELLKSRGVCTWQCMPYSGSNGCSVLPTADQIAEAAKYKISSYSRIIKTDQTAIKTMIATNHPVIATFTIDDNFYNASPGFIWKSLSGTSCSHTMTLCGYDDEKHAYKAINSWGTGWGDAGYIWIDYDFFPTAATYYTYVMTL